MLVSLLGLLSNHAIICIAYAANPSLDDLLWVYVGKQDSEDNEFHSQYFDLKKPPIKNDKLTPSTTMSLRESPPRKEGDIWVKSERISFLWPNMHLFVIEPKKAQATGSAKAKGVTHFWAGGLIGLTDNPSSTKTRVWFVVVSSETSLESARKRAKFIGRTYKKFPAEVFLSENGYYAVVIGSNLTQGEAKERVLEARKKGIAEDAYIWPSLGWGKNLLGP